MYKYIVENYYGDSTPAWMKHSRFETLMLMDKWLEGTFYDKIPLAFNEEKTGNTYHEMHKRRPGVQHNFPAFIAGLTARKLFGGRHVPRLKHEDKAFLKNVQALVEELRLPLKMLEAVKRGSVGSVAILFKFLKVPVRDLTEEEKQLETPPEIETTVHGVVEVKCAQYCTPSFNQFEELTGLLEHYLVSGAEITARGMTRERAGDPIKPNLKYWYVRMHDTKMDCIYFPLKEHDWNPVEGWTGPEISGDALTPYPFQDEKGNITNPLMHNLGFVQGVWIQNLTGGKFPDGLSTYALALDNFIEIDYAKSQNGRGLKYSSAPQLVIKGDLRSEVEGEGSAMQPRDPSYMIRLAADEKGMDGQSSSTGHDAKLLETNGAAAKASDDFVNSLKHTSFEQICSARKDLESIKGTMSGKVIELIDEDFLDLLQELRLQYGPYGYLLLVKKLAKAASIAGHRLMKKAADTLIDGLLLDFPPLYLPDAQEVQFLVSAFVEATATQEPGPTTKGADGSSKQEMLQKEPLIDPKLAAAYLAKQLDLVEESEDKPAITDTNISDTESQPSPPAESNNTSLTDEEAQDEDPTQQIIIDTLKEPV